MLATVIVIMLGTVLCTVLGVLAASDAALWILIGVSTLSALMIFWVVWLRWRRGAPGGLAFWHAVGRNHREEGQASQYRPRKVKDGQSETPAGTNQPITAEEAHEIQSTSSNAWVPSRNREGGNA